MILLRFAFLPALVLTLSGCGGGGESVTSRPRVRVHWPALGRSIQASAYANSIRLTLPNARLAPSNVNGVVDNDVVLEVNRTADADSEAVYSLPADIKPGKLSITIETFTQANQQGRQIQMKTESAYVQPDGFLPDIELGNGSGTVKSVSLTVEVPPSPPGFPQDIPTTYIGNSPRIIVFEDFATPVGGLDASHDVRWQVEFSENPDGAAIEGAPFLETENIKSFLVKTIHPGIVTLRASVDGVLSEAVQFRVIPRP